MHAGSKPWLTRSAQSVHLKTFFAVGLNLGMLNGHPVTQYLQPMHVVVSISLQTSYSRITPAPGTGPAWPEILRTSSVAWLILGSPYTFSILTRKPLNSGVYALGSTTVGVSRFTTVFAFLPSSS